MRRLLQVITAGFFLSGLLSAQNPGRDHDTFLELFRRELAFRELENSRAEIDRELALRRRATDFERQFISRVNRFVALWSALVSEYNEKRAFNVKLAGEVAKAFHDLEKSEGWLKQNGRVKEAAPNGNLR